MSIGHGDLRLGKMIVCDSTPHFAGIVPAWHHLECLFKRPGVDWETPTSHDKFRGWESIDAQHQATLKAHVAGRSTPPLKKRKTIDDPAAAGEEYDPRHD
jgi:hypothetical protein